MLSMALWIALVLAGLVHVLALKASVRLVGGGADNAWDNAFGHLLVAGALWWPARLIWGTGSWALLALVPVLCAVVLTGATRVIYEVGTRRALLIGALQLAFFTVMTTTLTLVAGVIAAYIEYGRIISDPLRLVRIVLRLIGIEPPF